MYYIVIKIHWRQRRHPCDPMYEVEDTGTHICVIARAIIHPSVTR